MTNTRESGGCAGETQNEGQDDALDRIVSSHTIGEGLDFEVVIADKGKVGFGAKACVERQGDHEAEGCKESMSEFGQSFEDRFGQNERDFGGTFHYDCDKCSQSGDDDNYEFERIDDNGKGESSQEVGYCPHKSREAACRLRRRFRHAHMLNKLLDEVPTGSGGHVFDDERFGTVHHCLLQGGSVSRRTSSSARRSIEFSIYMYVCSSKFI